ncbi:unnamed protein product [marine sediment metagenome]|uniref:Uncharacterized protein n=1 Tax=marine sediment metagenome TaxID=412755 RepID=X1D0P3_9ZZZZ
MRFNGFESDLLNPALANMDSLFPSTGEEEAAIIGISLNLSILRSSLQISIPFNFRREKTRKSIEANSCELHRNDA